jgi:hypothetical protein
MSLWNDKRKDFIFDSFKGFDKLSDKDPAHQQDAFNYDYNLKLIKNFFVIYRQARVIEEVVPATFKHINNDEKYSLVFFDCDLYQPALDTYHYFWDKLKKGGMLVIYDNVATIDGWTGVRKATEDYFTPRRIKFHDLWETTMSVIIK